MTKKQREKNEAFWRLNKATRRVRVARDVIVAIETEKIVATHMTYMNDKLDLDDVPAETPVEDVLPESCHVCAIGGMFVGMVRRADRVTVDDIGRGSFINDMAMRRYLGRTFDRGQLNLIEQAFERTRGPAATFAPDTEGNDRLRAIMQNIIDNHGTFVP